MFKFKEKIIRQTGNDGTKEVEIMVSLKFFTNFWKTLEIPLISCEIRLMLNRSKNCFLVTVTAANKHPTLTITNTKLCIPVVNSSTKDNLKLLKQLESGSKITIYWNKYHSKITEQVQN